MTAGSYTTLNEIRQEHDGQLPAYAWPGCYPLFYLDSRDNILCTKCARELDMDPDTWVQDLPVVVGVNWEDAWLHCDQCGERCESAYAEDCFDGTCDGADCCLADDNGCKERAEANEDEVADLTTS